MHVLCVYVLPLCLCLCVCVCVCAGERSVYVHSSVRWHPVPLCFSHRQRMRLLTQHRSPPYPPPPFPPPHHAAPAHFSSPALPLSLTILASVYARVCGDEGTFWSPTTHRQHTNFRTARERDADIPRRGSAHVRASLGWCVCVCVFVLLCCAPVAFRAFLIEQNTDNRTQVCVCALPSRFPPPLLPMHCLVGDRPWYKADRLLCLQPSRWPFRTGGKGST